MDNFIVSARKYRPSTFQSVVGQASITTTLKNAIQRNQLAQAYLFCGPRGVGKTTCARIFAKTINCQNLTPELEACNECESCTSFNTNRSYNIHELDAASNNSVEGIRKLIEQVRIPPQVGKYSVYIIDEVHMLSQSAFNAFLKTLEEPPAHAIFIMATTEKHKILPTILSRCQIYDFNRIKVEDTVKYLEYIAKQEGVEYEVEALSIIAQKADGAMRDALSIFDQVVSFSDNHITYAKIIENLNVLDYQYYFRLTDNFLSDNMSDSLRIFDELLSKGFDAQQFITGLSLHFRNILVSKDPQTIQLLEVGAAIAEKYKQAAGQCSMEFLVNAMNLTNQFDVSFRQSPNQRLHVELLLIRLCRLNQEKKKSDNPSVETENVITPKAAAQGVADTNTKPTPLKAVTKTTSLKGILKGEIPVNKPAQVVATNEPVAVSIEKADQFTQEQLNKAWFDFAQTMAKAKPSIFTIMSDCEPKLCSNFGVDIEVRTQVQIDLLQEISQDLLTHLKRSLNNTQINLNYTIGAVEKANRPSMYTSHDKLKFMAEKNPALIELMNKLNLVIE